MWPYEEAVERTGPKMRVHFYSLKVEWEEQAALTGVALAFDNRGYNVMMDDTDIEAPVWRRFC